MRNVKEFLQGLLAGEDLSEKVAAEEHRAHEVLWWDGKELLSLTSISFDAVHAVFMMLMENFSHLPSARSVAVLSPTGELLEAGVHCDGDYVYAWQRPTSDDFKWVVGPDPLWVYNSKESALRQLRFRAAVLCKHLAPSENEGGAK